MSLPCIKCGVGFNDVMGLVHHLNSYPASESERFKCIFDGCFTVFSNQHLLRRHLNKHVKKGDKVRTELIIKRRLQCSSQTTATPATQAATSSSVSRESKQSPTAPDLSSSSSEDLDPGLFESDFDKYILAEFVKLHAKSSMSESTTNSVIAMVVSILNIIFIHLKTINQIKDIETFISNTLFTLERFKNVAKIKQYLQRKNYYLKPSKFLVQNKTVQIIDEDNVRFENLESHGMLMPIEDQLTKFLELPGVLNQITEYRDNIMANKVDGQYESFLHGKKWQAISSKYEGKNLIPITLYTDDFQVDDKSGPHSTTNSIAAFYYQIACLPTYMMSKIEYIFVALLAHAEDLKKHSPDSALYTLVEIFTKLEVEGLSVRTEDGKIHQIHFVLCNAVGDNLGLHMMCGLILSFNASYFCRFCNAHLHQTRVWHRLPADIAMKTIDEYKRILETLGEAFGINRESILNLLPSFHVITNFTADIMHDLLLGTFKYELKHLIISYVSTLKRIDLETLNAAIKKHAKIEGLHLSEIKPNHLSERGSLQFNAREMWFLAQHLPLIFPTPETDDDNERKYYEFGLSISCLWEKCFRPSFDNQSLEDLTTLISKHLLSYRELFNDTLKAKHHFLLHYRDVIEQSGPLRYLMCMRFESKHQQIKGYTNISFNRRNVCFSAAQKLCFQFSHFIMSYDSFKSYIHSFVEVEKKPDTRILSAIQLAYPVELIFGKKVTFKGTTYQVGDYIVVSDFAIMITDIVMIERKIILIYKKAMLIFDERLGWYQIQHQPSYQQISFFEDLTSFENGPVKKHDHNGKDYITKIKRF